jgi:glycosyltransferase involved in cell wall biosynthesis
MISIVVCTCNREDKLAKLLESLAAMTVPDGVAWELIVVDNNSKDGTAALLAAAEAAGTLPLQRLFEKGQGLANAHNTALHAARGDVIAFTDDDCRVAQDWLAVLAREFRDGTLALLGGRVELFNPEDRPVTIRVGLERLELTFGSWTIETIIGCNMAFRRDIATRVGGFDTRFGSGCNIAPSGDDTEFVYRVLRAGGRVVYSPDLVVLHDHGRRTDAQVRSLQQVYLRGRGAIYAKHLLQRDPTIIRLAYWETSKLLAGVLRGPNRKADLFALSNLLKGAARFLWLSRRGGELDPTRT